MSDFGFVTARLAKREALRELGIDPYPYSYRNSVPIRAVVEWEAAHSTAANEQEREFRIVGRIWARRNMGRALFIDLRDHSGSIQLYCRRDRLAEETWRSLRLVEAGDLVGAQGRVFRTQSGELSIAANDVGVLAKAVVPLPVGKEKDDRKYYQPTDPELRYRHRYVHWILSPDDRLRIERRSSVIGAIRRRMEAWGFLEVSTPTIEPVYGGAEARPFETKVWALGDQRAFLRISPELYLKRYIVAGFPRVFTICQNFRNEGIDRWHNPEFTMMEWYEALTDYVDQMARFEELVSGVCQDCLGSMRFQYQGQMIDVTPPWRRLTMLDALRQYADIDAEALTPHELTDELRSRGVTVNGDLSWGVAVAELFAATCETRLIQPTFICDYPAEVSPLTKRKRGNSRLVERFEPFILGAEVGNAYSELTDPVEQLERFQEQRERRTDDYEVHPIDDDFIRAVGCGMPPTGGVGLGVDRLVMLLTNAPSIRDIIPFPMMRRST